MKLCAVSHALDSFYFTILSVESQHQAREDRASIDQNRTRAALSELTTVLGSSKAKILAQHFQQSLVRSKRDFDCFAV